MASATFFAGANKRAVVRLSSLSKGLSGYTGVRRSLAEKPLTNIFVPDEFVLCFTMQTRLVLSQNLLIRGLRFAAFCTIGRLRAKEDRKPWDEICPPE